MSGPPLSEREIRALVRQGIENGHLPILRVAKLDAGYGDGHACSVCAERILESQVEYEVRGARNRRLRFHIKCFALWQLECAGRIEPDGGAAPPRVRSHEGREEGGNEDDGSPRAAPKSSTVGPFCQPPIPPTVAGGRVQPGGPRRAVQFPLLSCRAASPRESAGHRPEIGVRRHSSVDGREDR
jgi:hypothetical protein